ncbi:hypothetical protein [Streptomyces roseifaciens]|uniref:hypothetical protein n=1 Tax=Streptomyces roseifaciens TaxID=1488406 RepID=UPI000717F2F6|nr:hypothetical protein [Streptomyces roseifaciens]
MRQTGEQACADRESAARVAANAADTVVVVHTDLNGGGSAGPDYKQDTPDTGSWGWNAVSYILT